MVISRNLLAEFFPGIKELDPQQISRCFFKGGIEVEALERIVEPTGLFYGLIEGVSFVEGSDKLKLCSVFIPLRNERFSIVCGASNVRENLKVLVALPGAKLMNGEFVITERRFKAFNVESHGMICAYSELYRSQILKNIADFERGKIIELDESWEINREFRAEDLWLNDWIFDLSIPANRGDLHSAWGLSREMAKILNVPAEHLAHGNPEELEKDSWLLKRKLLTNNLKPSENQYSFLAFNVGNGPGVRKKSSYFDRLNSSFLSGSPLVTFEKKRIQIDRQRLFRFLGIDPNWSHDEELFSLGEDHALVPEWREDLAKERDIAEEIISLVGWEEMEPKAIAGNIQRHNGNELILAIEGVREFWKAYGFYECNTFNLHALKKGELSVSNPVSNHHVSLRSHALGELMEALAENHQRKTPLLPVFEIFQCQYGDKPWVLSAVVPEPEAHFPLNQTRITLDPYDLRALLERSLRYSDRKLVFSPLEKPQPPFLETNCLEISDLGQMGYLKSPIPIRMWGFHCILPPPSGSVYSPRIPSKYPPSYKDISLELPDEGTIPLSRILQCLKCRDLVSVKLMEKYLSDRFCSYLLRIRLQSHDHTLTKDEIRENLEEIYSSLKALEGLKIR